MDAVRAVDPVRNARGRPERSLVLTGLRGVGKTVLLGELRSMAELTDGKMRASTPPR